MFEEYKNTLSKQQVKLFDKVVKLYKELRPYYYDEVISNIDKLKISEKSKNEMFKFNEYIYSNFFKSGEFLKEYGDFKIGDKIYSDLTSKEYTIKEFSTYENCVYIIRNDYNFALPTPLLIETVNHSKRDNKEESIYSRLQKENFNKNLNITKINSRLYSFLEYYLTGQIDFNPKYQRDLVWTTEQKEKYIKALIQDKADITPTFITKPYTANDYLYEVLDGKQRLNAILSYIKGEFSIDGIYYKDLTQADVHKFLRTPYNYTIITYINEKGENSMPENMKIELFLQINEYGTKISQEELTRIKNSTGDKERNI